MKVGIIITIIKARRDKGDRSLRGEKTHFQLELSDGDMEKMFKNNSAEDTAIKGTCGRGRHVPHPSTARSLSLRTHRIMPPPV